MKTLHFDLVSISVAAKFYGVSVQTLRRWDKASMLKPQSRTLGNHRRYCLQTGEKLRVGYARVSSHDQKSDLQTQVAYLAP
ncbi:MerR family DNA-binding transcriptional regulator, partial [Alteromonas macleodii]|uniref:MerR family DNA-binding transcriptional regulator n=1 Tax=Alteromonas macleodii TaxID=28108 RepID=UPI003140ADFF